MLDPKSFLEKRQTAGYQATTKTDDSSTKRRVISDEEMQRLAPAPTSSASMMETDQPKSQGIFSALRSFGRTPGEFLKGQLKGAATTALSMGEIGSSALEYGYDKTIGKLTGKEAFKGAETAKQAKDSELLERKNLAQKAGFMTEQIGEFFAPVPGGAKAKAAGFVAEKMPSVIKLAEKYPKLATIPKIGGGLAKDAADVYARTYLQTADEEKSTDAALWTALLGAPFKTYEKVKPIIGKDLSGRVVNSLIKPSKSDFAYGKNPGKAIADEGIIASNFEDLQNAVGDKKKEIGAKIEIILNKPENVGKVASVDDALAIIDDAIATAEKAPRTNSAQIKRLKDAKSDLLQETVDDAGDVIYGRSTKDLTVAEINQMKRDVGEITAYTGNPSDDKAVNEALQGVYSSLKKKVESVVPEIKKVNERYGNLLSADKAIRNRKMIVERQNLISLPQMTGGAGAAIVTSILTGGAAVPTLLAGAGLVAAEKAFSTPIAKTIIGKWLAQAKASDLLQLYKVAPRLFQIVTGQNETVNTDQQMPAESKPEEM